MYKRQFLYWNQDDYRGFGCAAHSHRAGRRWWNLRTPDRYIEAVRSGASVEASSETLDTDTRRLEALQLAVRTRDGVPRTSFLPETLTILEGMVIALTESFEASAVEKIDCRYHRMSAVRSPLT